MRKVNNGDINERVLVRNGDSFSLGNHMEHISELCHQSMGRLEYSLTYSPPPLVEVWPLKWVEECSPPKLMFFPDPQNVTLFGNKVVADVVS